jgi:hypothetical protein
MARRFPMKLDMKECPMRFGVVAMEDVSCGSPVVRLHIAAFYPQMWESLSEIHQNQRELDKMAFYFPDV